MEEELKLGRAAYAAGNFDEAIEHFTDVLEDVSADQDTLHVVLSNRCACYMQVKKLNKAFDDAESCTSYKPNWAKGWSRLGAVLDMQSRLQESVAAYEKAAEVEEGDTKQYTDDADRVKLKIEARDVGARARRQPGEQRRQGGPRPESWTSKSEMLEKVHFLLRLAVLASAVVYLTTFTTDRAVFVRRYRNVVKLLLGSGALDAFRSHGVPRRNKEYIQAVMSAVAVQRCFGAILLMVGASFVAVLPLVYAELASAVSSGVAKLRAHGAPWSKRAALLIVAWCEGKLLDGEGRVDQPRLDYNAAYLEVAAGLILAVELLSPRRNLLLLMMYWQYLQMRFMLEAAAPYLGPGALHNAFDALDAKILGLCASAPAVVGTIYEKIKSFFKRQTKLPPPGEKPGLKCSIM